jgi:putative membrane-bound dehydrogenase-like protein
MHWRSLISLTLLAALLASPAAGWQIPEGVKSSQKPEDKPLTPEEAVDKIILPKGFSVSLFAGEPHVAQPIAFTFDDRGRLWVAECYSYGQWDREGKKGLDRVIILEDTNGDGKFDERKVFAQNLVNLSGLELGFGGVWICSAPNLYFIPDKDGDDKPDGDAVSKIDGWIVGNVGHNIFSNLTWGPDGWLYGLHGIQDESKIGKPGTPEEERIKLRCGVWRYHPVKDRIEVVCQGTTNPWGLDFNDMGEGFMTNCVIGHLWQVIPGAHYKRMYGEDYNRYAYELIDQHADHLHWAGAKWTDARGGDAHDKLGGGHAHVGAMCYLADNWPVHFRSMIGTCNVHGQRLNFDKLEREGSGYVGRRGEDIFFAHDAWFRGITVKYGPDGGVYISDWTDLGECHDNDGVHRTSGRIYKVVYMKPSKVDSPLDMAKSQNDALADAHTAKNEWYVRKARRLLQERAAAGDDVSGAQAKLKSIFADDESTANKLRALWTLHATGGADEAFLVEQLSHKDEFVRKWAIQLLVEETSLEKPASEGVASKFASLAKDDSSQVVRLALASAMQRLPLAQRWPIATNLVAHEEDNDDHNLPLMVWYGIEPAVAADKPQALKLAATSKVSKVRQFIAKRVAEASK